MALGRTVDVESWDLPAWASEVRPHQVQAVEEIVQLYRGGCDLVVLDAPTGSGKTLIAELVRQELAKVGSQASYVCSSLTLQDQFALDFPEAKVIMGRDNYPTVYGGEDVTAGDCQGPVCGYCPENGCPYQVAKAEAEGAEVAVLNSTYQLYASNFTRSFRVRDLVIVDECDTLEGEVLRFAECYLGEGYARAVGMKIPGPGVRYTTVAAWLAEWEGKAKEHVRKIKVTGRDGAKQKRRWEGLIRNAAMVREDLLVEPDLWVRQPNPRALVMKPVKVDRFMDRLVWDHGSRFLLMSATVISAEQMVRDLGWRGKWGSVTVPMTFPVENRRIIARGNIDMAAKNKDTAWPQMAMAVNRVLSDHPHDNVLVHTVSYELAAFLYEKVHLLHHKGYTYRNRTERADVLEQFRGSNVPCVLYAPSMDRGVDLPDDLCRVQVVAKVPFPYLGDRQVSARMRLPGGQTWYAVETVRKLVQMTGRGVRSANDWCVTYILDAQFKKNVLARSRRFLPPWWREAVERE